MKIEPLQPTPDPPAPPTLREPTRTQQAQFERLLDAPLREPKASNKGARPRRDQAVTSDSATQPETDTLSFSRPAHNPKHKQMATEPKPHQHKAEDDSCEPTPPARPPHATEQMLVTPAPTALAGQVQVIQTTVSPRSAHDSLQASPPRASAGPGDASRRYTAIDSAVHPTATENGHGETMAALVSVPRHELPDPAHYDGARNAVAQELTPTGEKRTAATEHSHGKTMTALVSIPRHELPGPTHYDGARKTVAQESMPSGEKRTTAAEHGHREAMTALVSAPRHERPGPAHNDGARKVVAQEPTPASQKRPVADSATLVSKAMPQETGRESTGDKAPAHRHEQEQPSSPSPVVQPPLPPGDRVLQSMAVQANPPALIQDLQALVERLQLQLQAGKSIDGNMAMLRAHLPHLGMVEVRLIQTGHALQVEIHASPGSLQQLQTARSELLERLQRFDPSQPLSLSFTNDSGGDQRSRNQRHVHDEWNPEQ